MRTMGRFRYTDSCVSEHIYTYIFIYCKKIYEYDVSYMDGVGMISTKIFRPKFFGGMFGYHPNSRDHLGCTPITLYYHGVDCAAH